MFISDTHQPQVLDAEAYHSVEQHEREIEKLFMPAWHMVASEDQFKWDGDYLTYDLLGYPLITWFCDGEFHTFLNVCPHRSAHLRKKPCGNAKPLKCQYHGWEFGTCGATQRIPDAPSFKPLKKGQLGLKKIRTEKLGPLIYVCLDEESGSLDDFYGTRNVEFHNEVFNSRSRLVYSERRMNPANWKIVVENSLESYHLDEVHPKTFYLNPEEQFCSHELDERCCYFNVSNEKGRKQTPLLISGEITRRLLGEPELEHRQLNQYPHISIGKVGFLIWFECTIPISPTESYDEYRVYCTISRPNSVMGRLLGPGLKWFGYNFFRRLLKEDKEIFPLIQKGLESPVRPGPGLLSRREERLHHFQEYILRETT